MNITFVFLNQEERQRQAEEERQRQKRAEEKRLKEEKLLKANQREAVESGGEGDTLYQEENQQQENNSRLWPRHM